MNYIVLDLEWNQCPDGREGSLENLPFEIMEIGAVKLDENFRPAGEFHRLVRPQVYQELHPKIREVTHMDLSRLKEAGKPFSQAAEEFFRWCGPDCRFVTWGPMDLTELQRNMSYFQVENPLPRPLLYYDAQKLYCILYGDGKTKLSLDQAALEQGIGCEEPFHQALDDARYTARILASMDFEKVRPYVSVDYYRLPATREEEVFLRFPDYFKYVSSVFPSREEALQDKVVTDMVCPVCNRMLRKKVRWFPLGQRACCGLAVCPEHGLVKGKLRVRKEEYGGTYVIKTMKAATEEEAALIGQKHEEARKRRNSRNHMRQRRRKTPIKSARAKT